MSGGVVWGSGGVDTKIISAQLWNTIYSLQKSFIEPYFNRIFNKFTEEVLPVWWGYLKDMNLPGGGAAADWSSPSKQGGNSSEKVLETFFIFMNMVHKNYLVHYCRSGNVLGSSNNSTWAGSSYVTPLLKTFVGSLYKVLLEKLIDIEAINMNAITNNNKSRIQLCQDLETFDRGMWHFVKASYVVVQNNQQEREVEYHSYEHKVLSSVVKTLQFMKDPNLQADFERESTALVEMLSGADDLKRRIVRWLGL